MDSRAAPKGILKNASTRRETDHDATGPKSPLKWDEDNLLVNESEKPATRMKIDEPKTPYHHGAGASEDDSDEPEPDLGGAVESLEAIEKRKQWESKRKQHYKVDGAALLKHARPSQLVHKDTNNAAAAAADDKDDD